MLDGELIGFIRLSVKPNFISEIVQQSNALGETGEWIVVIKNDNGDAVFVSKTRYENEGALNRTVLKRRLMCLLPALCRIMKE